MDYANDRYDVMAMLFGGPGYLTPQQRVDLAMIFRTIAKDEREACALVALNAELGFCETAYDMREEIASAIRSRTEGEGK